MVAKNQQQQKTDRALVFPEDFRVIGRLQVKLLENLHLLACSHMVLRMPHTLCNI